MGESKARDPLAEESRRWIALGATGCHSLREGMCCEERSSCDSQRAPSAKKVCDCQTHTDTTVHNTHGHSFLPFLLPSFHSDTPQATRSTARRVSQECLTRVVCSCFSKTGGSCSAKRGFAPGLPSSSRSVPTRTDGVFRYVRLLGCSVQLSFGVATLRICIRPRRPLVSGVKRVGRAMRPTCSLAVDKDLETHCAGLARVSMRLVAVTLACHVGHADFVDGALYGRRRLLSLPGEQCWCEMPLLLKLVKGLSPLCVIAGSWHFGLHDKPEHSVSTGALQGNC